MPAGPNRSDGETPPTPSVHSVITMNPWWLPIHYTGVVMRRAHLAKFALVAGAFALVAGACSSDSDDSGSSSDADGGLVLGSMVPQTGDLNTIVKSLQEPINIAVQEINDAGGVLGKPVKLIEGDDGTSPTVAEATYAKLVNTDKVNAIVGPAPSGVAAKLADKLGVDQVPACSGSTTAANLDGAGNGFFFRTAPGDDLQGPALADLIAQDGHTKVAILARNDDYGTGFSEALQKALTDSGAQVTSVVLYNPDSGSGYDADVQKALDSQPDAVAVLGFNDDGAQIVSALIGKGAGPADKPIYTADGMQGSSFAETVDPSDLSKVSGIKGTAPSSNPQGIEHPFAAKFAETGIDTIFSAYYYDCTNLLALAAEAGKSTKSADIQANFAKNLEGENDCTTFADCKKLLEDGKTIHYRGASQLFEGWNVMQPSTGVYDIWSYDAKGEVVTAPEQISVP